MLIGDCAGLQAANLHVYASAVFDMLEGKPLRAVLEQAGSSLGVLLPVSSRSTSNLRLATTACALGGLHPWERWRWDDMTHCERKSLADQHLVRIVCRH